MNKEKIVFRAAKQMTTVMKDIRRGHFSRDRVAVDPTKPVIYFEETCVNGQAFDVPLVILRTRPCRWFEAGGCTMCNYELLAIDEGVSEEDILSQVDHAIDCLAPMSKYAYVFITSQGSFFDDNEVSEPTRLKIAKKLKKAGIQAMSTESEAKYCVHVDRINKFRAELSAPISIGIGYESHDSVVRNVVVNKGLPPKTFERATERLKENEIAFYTYVVLGKPFLTIKEDIDDAVEATMYSFQSGAFMVVTETINVQPYTLIHKMYEQGEYIPVSLWTANEYLAKLPSEIRKKVSLKGMEADIAPVPIALPTSCKKCESTFLHAIREWNYTRNYTELSKNTPECECKEDWRIEALASNENPILTRVTNWQREYLNKLGN